MDALTLITEIKAYSPRAGDILLVNCAHKLRHEEREVLAKQLLDVLKRAMVPDSLVVLIIDDGTTFEVIRREGEVSVKEVPGDHTG